jgi:hypothetical protein
VRCVCPPRGADNEVTRIDIEYTKCARSRVRVPPEPDLTDSIPTRTIPRHPQKADETMLKFMKDLQEVRDPHAGSRGRGEPAAPIFRIPVYGHPS